MMPLGLGRPEPLGAAYDGAGVNFAVHSAHADAIDLCLFDADGGETRIPLPGRTGAVFHGRAEGLALGARYGFRAHGPFAPHKGHRFNPAKLLVDPFAAALDRPFALHPSLFDARRLGAVEDGADSAPFVPKALVIADLPAASRLASAVPWDRQIVYELHVRGFTMRHPGVPEALRGTFAGLAQPAAIDHLVRLGVTVVELMPSAAWIDERHLPPLGLSNYWGYNPIAFCAPDPRLAPGGWPEVRAAIAALHAAGIAVILDVVFNHSGESDHLGPTLSMRGLDNASWYRLRPDDPALYIDDAGCGNILAADRPIVVRLVMDALRRWADAGLDGFRFDLATTLARRPGGFDAEAPLLTAIAQDPRLRDLTLIAEPWDIGPGGYQLGEFPAGWGEWNDEYRDAVRRFWRGDAGLLGAFATRFAGSADVFVPRCRPLSRSINFVTAHDGFTLADLVAYERKHNRANGEDNRDGTDDNKSWNNGAEGPSDDPAVATARANDVRALLATLLVSRGTPMLAMGDEAGRSQAGNNNAYAQDGPIAWFDWAGKDEALVDYTAALIRLRARHPALRDERPLGGAPNDQSGVPDVLWLRPDGAPMAEADWHGGRAVVAVLYADADRVAVAVNGASEAPALRLAPPRPGFRWERAIASAEPPAPDRLAPRSVSVFVEVAAPE